MQVQLSDFVRSSRFETLAFSHLFVVGDGVSMTWLICVHSGYMYFGHRIALVLFGANHPYYLHCAKVSGASNSPASRVAGSGEGFCDRYGCIGTCVTNSGKFFRNWKALTYVKLYTA